MTSVNNFTTYELCRYCAKELGYSDAEIDAGDIFVENLRNCITAIENGRVTKDTKKLTEHVRVILAVKAAIEEKEDF